MSSSDSDMNVVGAQSQCTQSEWSRAPWKKSKGDNDEDGDDLFAPNEYVPAPTSEWCNCGKCHGWPEPAMNVCCQQHQIWQTKDYGGPVEVECICDCDVIQDLLKPGPLRMMYHNYRSYHVPRYPDAEQIVPIAQLSQDEINKRINAQRRLSAYRALIFWTFPDIRRRDRRPLPSCVYGMVRAMYPSEEDEEL